MKNERTCIVCRKKQNSSLMQRVSLKTCGEIEIDSVESNKKSGGRGAYVCKTKQCCEKAVKTMALNRAFKKQVDKNVYDKLKLRGEEFDKE